MSFFNSTFGMERVFAFVPDNPARAADSMFMISRDLETQSVFSDSEKAKIESQPGVASVIANAVYSTVAECASPAPNASGGGPKLSSVTLSGSAGRATGRPQKLKRSAASNSGQILDQNVTSKEPLQKRDGDYVRQINPERPWQLKVVSQPTDAATVGYFP